MIRLLCFGRLGDSLGRVADLQPPDRVETVADLLDWLATRGSVWQQEMSTSFRVALNQEIVALDSRLNHGDEVVLLPRVSGG